MKVVIAPDKFKGSLTAADAANAISDGVRLVHPDAEVTLLPMADGGEGTWKILTALHSGEVITTLACDPLFKSIKACYGISSDGSTAFIDVAEASGLHLIPSVERNPMFTTTFGTGQLVKDALDHGVKKIILGIGGSATNDAGIGMAAALGVTFLDRHGKEICPIGKNLIDLATIEVGNSDSRLKHAEVLMLCDVRNPLFGKDGAAFIYAGQKGASASERDLLDRGLRNFHRVIETQFGVNTNFAGAGAAGGLGAAGKFFLQAVAASGIEYLLSESKLEEHMRTADLVITGEGKLDSQSLSGKVVYGIATAARKYHKAVMVVCGVNELHQKDLNTLGIQTVLSLSGDGISTDDAMRNAGTLIREKVSDAIRPGEWLGK